MMNQPGLVMSIERHRLEVSRFLHGRIGCAETAADIYQSIAESLLRRNPEPPIKNVRAFLFEAARNAASNQQRAERSKTKFAVLAQPLLEESGGHSPEVLAEAQETLNRVNQALLDLPLMTRRVFILYRIRGHKQKDIASQLGVSVSTVEKHVSKALSHCYNRLRD